LRKADDRWSETSVFSKESIVAIHSPACDLEGETVGQGMAPIWETRDENIAILPQVRELGSKKTSILHNTFRDVQYFGFGKVEARGITLSVKCNVPGSGMSSLKRCTFTQVYASYSEISISRYCTSGQV
jgi:hypothetical protein